ncbi:MAG: pyruvate formate lyase-activating protein [Bacteroidetes bacterium GWF2_42_66]|nr:MAG: pyruvate formate lyase-activating protein [Bacteroidetes bacterium GWA2_42_15]OFX99488.1 MAG: pyruvate formate lyase-activating protein [Bacteroidetes bacterium GWE2_42_39]OFY47019.1 MAG: pyruvate formate lyase-activating protein [Bacteroidetes bacterium GWF2_42_66]HAZ04281.1 glycyl-radical enzyme activating protein [Marinilabiliales bacterium]HBL76824.1 glycyl-radical enzyme activating protein [Prolixibacteraceae bacterium]
MSKGTIFNIEEFAVHDGPGIRKLVFFKGCPLHCSWCHNPEGISFRKELMVSHTACIDCSKCREVCTSEKCIACGRCIEVCPLRLRKVCGQEFEACELANELLKGKEILINSGGGITISGGEPLAQPAFLFGLIEHLKPLNIAVETSGHAAAPIFQKMVSVVDLVLMDIKHTDPVIHKRYTGVDNHQILENLEFLCGSDTDFYIRVPLIPGVNDTRENMEKTAWLLKDAKHLKRVELLPYHQTAGAKYPMVNKQFDPGFDTNKKVNVWKDVFENYNINISVL